MSAGWKHGDTVDEQAKTHPLLKPYKNLSEKVQAHRRSQLNLELDVKSLDRFNAEE